MGTLFYVFGGLGLACVPLGFLLDYLEGKYGRPPRLPIRYEFIGVLIAIPLTIASIVVGVIPLSSP
jgi:hypothetical protein